MADAFHSSPENIGGMIGPTRREKIIVPAFQRGYAWKDKNVQAFWTDLLRFHRSSKKKGGPDAYFLGPIVTLWRREDKTILLLDGQQRLATATILLSVLRDIALEIKEKTGATTAHDFALLTQTQYIEKEGRGFALEMGETDAVYFRETIQEAIPNRKLPAKLRTHKNILTAQRRLAEGVRTMLGDLSSTQAISDLKELRQTLISDLVMARIPVEAPRDAFRIFETLNDRGLRLSAPDLLLNYLMGAAPDADHDHIRRMWSEMVNRMGLSDITTFLRHMWVSRYGDLKEEDLFSALSAHIEGDEEQNREKIESIDFARLCAEECENYVQLISIDESQLDPKAVPHVRSLMRDLHVQSALPLLLSSYLVLEPAHFVNVTKWLLVFVTRYSIIADLNSSGMESLLFGLAREVRAMGEKGVSSNQIANQIKDTLKKNAPDTDATRKSAESLYFDSRGQAKYFMNRLARYMQSPTKETGPLDVNIEHVYPQNPDPTEWGGKANQEIMNEYLWHIGNLTIYGRKANRKVENKEYHIKQPRFATSQVTMTNEIAKTYKTWDVDVIEKRARRLAKLVVEVWDFDNTSRV
jgi:hypothetical protein